MLKFERLADRVDELYTVASNTAYEQIYVTYVSFIFIISILFYISIVYLRTRASQK